MTKGGIESPQPYCSESRAEVKYTQAHKSMGPRGES